MAVSLLSHEVSDLCIGKPAVRSLLTTATVGEALLALKLSGENYVSIVSLPQNSSKNIKNNNKAGGIVVGKLCMVDIICYLCAQENISSPLAALKNPVSVLVSKESAVVKKVEPNLSVLEAVDVILEGGAQTLIVPIVSSSRKKKVQQPAELISVCWLTQEDLVRYFINSIFLFSPIASLSLTDLGLVNPDILSVRPHEPAVSALPLIRSAIAEHTSVAVVTDDGKLIGEISPSTLSACDETVAAAIASLSAGDLMAYIDCCSGGVLPEAFTAAVKSRLKENGMDGMVRLMEEESALSLPLALTSSSGSSSEDDECSETVNRKRKPRRTRSGSYSARMGRKSEEAIVCHPGSSLVAVMVQALAHRVSYVWVVQDDYGLVGIVTFREVLRVFRDQFQ